MLLYLFLLFFVSGFLFLVFRLCQVFDSLVLFTRLLHGFVSDVKVDEIFLKAAMLGHLASFENEIDPSRQVTVAYEKGAAIVTDVLLQNGFNPRHYNIQALLLISRVKLGLTGLPKGGD